MILTDEKVAFLLEEVAELKSKYGLLHLKIKGEQAFLIGRIDFTATLEEETISDLYQIRIELPESYPDIPPAVEEIGGRIPKNVDHHVYPDNTLCLGPPIKLLLKFKIRTHDPKFC